MSDGAASGCKVSRNCASALVFNGRMKRSSAALLAALSLAVALPAAALAAEVVVGQTSTALTAPTCPSGTPSADCTIVLAQMTAFETLSDGVSSPTLVKQSGELFGFSLGISNISSNTKTRNQYVTELDKAYGGAPKVSLTVLRAVGRPSLQRWQVVAQSPLFNLASYLGQNDIEFSLVNEIPVVRGELLALTIPTWAPILSIDLSSSKFAYRQSRNEKCSSSSPPPSEQQRIGLMTTYGCSYKGARIEYTASEITSPSTSSVKRR